MLRPLVSEISSESESDFENVDETVFIARIHSEDGASRSAVEEVARRYSQEFTFSVLAQQEDLGSVQDMPVIKCHRSLDHEVKSRTGPFDSASLEAFVKEASVCEDTTGSSHLSQPIS